MSHFRHGARHVEKTLVEHVRACLTTGGWFSATPPYEAKPVEFGEMRADEWKGESVTPNYVGMTVDGGTPLDDLELGGGLAETATIITLDVLGQSAGIGLAIASDLQDWLAGEVDGVSEHLDVVDYSLSPPAPRSGHRLEITDVQRTRPDTELFRRQWYVVNATALWRHPRNR